MKKFFEKMKERFIWLTSRAVLDAINEGKSYEEVEQIVKERVEINFGKKNKKGV